MAHAWGSMSVYATLVGQVSHVRFPFVHLRVSMEGFVPVPTHVLVRHRGRVQRAMYHCVHHHVKTVRRVMERIHVHAVRGGWVRHV